MDIERALDGGSAVVGLQIPPGFSRDLKAGKAATTQILIDGTNSNTATVAQGYAGRIIQEFAVDQAASRGMKMEGGIDLRARAWYNPDLSSQVYNVPGVIGLLLVLMALLLTALAVVRERELGTLEQLMVSPISAEELILGKTVPVMIICLVDLALITVLALLWFHIPLQGTGGGPGSGLLPLHPGRLGGRSLHLRHFPDPAGSLSHHVPLHPPGDHPLGLHVPHRDHARVLSVC